LPTELSELEELTEESELEELTEESELEELTEESELEELTEESELEELTEVSEPEELSELEVPSELVELPALSELEDEVVGTDIFPPPPSSSLSSELFSPAGFPENIVGILTGFLVLSLLPQAVIKNPIKLRNMTRQTYFIPIF